LAISTDAARAPRNDTDRRTAIDDTRGTMSQPSSAPGSRLDIYAPIHRALRLFMSATLARVGALDVSDAREVPSVLDQLEALLEMCRQHALIENEIVHPAIEAVQAGATQRVHGEHVQHLAAIVALEAEAVAVRVFPNPSQAMRLYRHFALFVAENFEHMHFEETAHNEALWAGYDDAAIAVIEQRIVAQSTPHQRALVLRWMTPALPPHERAQRFRSLQAQLPATAFAAMLDIAREVLDDRGWAKLNAALAEEAAA
jgi:hypothetical protein